jgi:formamidopyrimidine-DNA glycosylase
MPELPEVETVKKDLEKKILGKKIIGLKAARPKVIKEPSLAKFKKGLIGESPQKIIRKAKLLIIKLKEDKFLIIHLRISGWLLYGEEDPQARVAIQFSDGKFLNYVDQRLLGELRLRNDYQDLKFVKELGPEPFELKAEDFKRIIKSRKSKIKPLLLDQKVIAGIGNIYAQEALFLAKIDPCRPANTLKDKEVKLLYQKTISLLEEAIKYRGSSVDSYRDLEGDKGGMEKRLKVYAREGKPCLACKKPIEKISLGGRGTCFCSRCQK